MGEAHQLEIDWTAQAARRSPPGLKLAGDERAVLDVLERHRGRDRALVSRDLARMARVTERRLRTILRHLVIEHRVAVGSSTGEPAGYYLIASDDERRTVRDSLFRRMGKLAQRARAYDRDGIADRFLGQLPLLEHGRDEEE